MKFTAFRSSLKRMVSAWWFTPLIGLISFAIPLLMPKTNVGKLVESLLYPPEQWAGAVSFRLADVPGYHGDVDVDLILLTHNAGDHNRVTLLRHGSTPTTVIAGAPKASLMIEQSKPRTNGTPLFDVDVPAETLLAASVASPRGGAPTRYTLITPDWEKEVEGKGDLVMLPLNELRKRRMTYWLSIFALGLAAIFMPRYAQLLHPEEEK